MKAIRYVMVLLLAIQGLRGANVSAPVGALEVNLIGNNAVNIVCSGGFMQKTVYCGTGSVSGTILDDPQADWTPDAFAGTHYVLLETGDWAGIFSNTETRLVLEAPLDELPEAAYRIVPYNTLSSLFGEDNFAGFTAGSGLAGSDILMPWDSTAQEFAGYYYFNSIRDRWEDMNNTYAGGTILYPDEAIIVVARRDNVVTLHGAVQTGRISGYVRGDGATTIIPNPWPRELPLADCGLETALAGGGTFAEADRVMSWSPVQQAYSDFYYFDTDDNLWRDLYNHPADSDDVIPPGTGVLVLRNSDGDSRWYMDQPFEVVE